METYILSTEGET